MSRSAKTNPSILKLIEKASSKANSSTVDYEGQLKKLKSEKEKIINELEIEIGLRYKIVEAKKARKRAKDEILKREFSITGYKGVEKLAAVELRKAQNQMLIIDAVSIASEEKKRIAAEEKENSLTALNTELTGGTHVGSIADGDSRVEIASYVSKLKEQIAAPELKVENAGQRRDALEVYLRAKGFIQAADSILDTGYIADVEQRNAVVALLNTLEAGVSRAIPRLSVIGNLVGHHSLDADEVCLVSSIITKEKDDQVAQKNAAEAKRDALVASTKLDLANAQAINDQQVIILESQKGVLEAEEGLEKIGFDTQQRNQFLKNKEEGQRNWKKAIDYIEKAIEATVNVRTNLLPDLIKRSEEAVKIVSEVDKKINQILQILSNVKNKKKIALDDRVEAARIIGTDYNDTANKVDDTNIVAAEKLLKDKLEEIREIRSSMLVGEIPASLRTEAGLIFAAAATTAIQGEVAAGTITTLLDALNGSDYELAQQVVSYKNEKDKASENKTIAETEIRNKEVKRDTLSKASATILSKKNSIKQLDSIKQLEVDIAKAHKEFGGLKKEIEYLKSSNQDSKIVQIKQLESALNNETRRKQEEELIVDNNDKKLRTTERVLRLLNETVSKLVTEAENTKLNEEDALETRKKAILKQFNGFGERGVQELATRLKDKAKVRTDRYDALILARDSIVNITLPNAIAAAGNYAADHTRADNTMTEAEARQVVADEATYQGTEVLAVTNAINAAGNYGAGHARAGNTMYDVLILAHDSIVNILPNAIAAAGHARAGKMMTEVEARQAVVNEATYQGTEVLAVTNAINAAGNYDVGHTRAGNKMTKAEARQAVVNEATYQGTEVLAVTNAINAAGNYGVDHARADNTMTEAEARQAVDANQLLQQDIVNKRGNEVALKAALDGILGGITLANATAIDNAEQAREARRAVLDGILGGITLANATAIDDAEQAREARRAVLDGILGGITLANATAIDNAEQARVAHEAALTALNNDIANEYFISGGYKAVEAFWTGKDDDLAREAGLKKEDAENLVFTQDNELVTKKLDKEALEIEISELDEKIIIIQNKWKDAEIDVVESQEFEKMVEEKENKDSQLETLITEIKNLTESLTINVMKAGGYTLLAQRAEEKIKTLDIGVISQEVVEKSEYEESLFKRKAVEKNQDETDKNLALYTIRIDDPTAKTPKTDRIANEDGNRSSKVLSEDENHIELVSQVAASLFDLNDDNNPSMDLVPELRYSAGIEAKAKSESAELYVAFQDPKQAAAFCSKMNSFQESGRGIIKPPAAFVTGFDKFGVPVSAEQGKNNWGQYITPLLQDKNSQFNGKYVVLIKAGGEGTKLTSFSFADEILKSKKAEEVIGRAEDTSLVQRIVEKKDEPIKNAVAWLTNLLGITPAVVVIAAKLLEYCITNPCRKLGIPGSSVVSTLNQGMYDFAAFGSKRGNLLSYFSPDTAKKYSDNLGKSSKDLQEKEEINAAQGMNGLKIFNNVFNAIITRPSTAFASVLLKGASLCGHVVGDFSFNKSKYFSDYAGRKWSEGGLSNAVPCVISLLAAIVTGIIGTASRTVGIGTGAIGEVLSKPSKAAHPEGSVAETRNILGFKLGNAVRIIDRVLDGVRKAMLTREETSKLEIKLGDIITSSPTILTADRIKKNSKTISTSRDKEEFDKIVRGVALDIKNPKFNQPSGIKGEKNEYMEVARVPYNDEIYKVSLGANGYVTVAQVGKNNDHSISNFPPSLSGKLPDFITAALESVSSKRAAEEGLTSPSSTLTLREFGMQFGGISSTSTPTTLSAGKVLKDYLGKTTKTYVNNTVRNVGEYSVKVDGDNNIHIGKIGQDLEVIEEGQAAKSLALFNVVSSLATQKGKQVDKQQSNIPPDPSLINTAERRLVVSKVAKVTNAASRRIL